MKKILSILLLLVFVYNMAGFFIVFRCEQYAAKREMKTFMKKDLADTEFEKIIISNKEIASGSFGFRYLDNNNEFYYKDKLYDIIRSNDDGNITVFICINDKNEERILSRLDEFIQQNNGQNLPGRSQTIKLVKGMIKDFVQQKSSILIAFTTKNILFCDNDQYLLTQFIPVSTPPPES